MMKQPAVQSAAGELSARSGKLGNTAASRDETGPLHSWYGRTSSCRPTRTARRSNRWRPSASQAADREASPLVAGSRGHRASRSSKKTMFPPCSSSAETPVSSCSQFCESSTFVPTIQSNFRPASASILEPSSSQVHTVSVVWLRDTRRNSRANSSAPRPTTRTDCDSDSWTNRRDVRARHCKRSIAMCCCRARREVDAGRSSTK